MAEGEGGGELDPVVAVLDGEDEGFLAMLERDIENAKAFTEQLQEVLTTGGDASGDAIAEGVAEGVDEARDAVAEGASEMAEDLAVVREAAEENADAFAEAWAAGAEQARTNVGDALDELAEQADTTAHQAGDAIAEGYGSGAGRAVEATAEAGEQISALLAQNTAETDAQAQALMDAQSARVRETAGSTAAALGEIAEAQAAFFDEVGATATVQNAATVPAGGQGASAAQGAAVAEVGAEAERASASMARLETVIEGVGELSGQSAAEVLAFARSFGNVTLMSQDYGIAEVQLAATTQLLDDANAQVIDSEAALTQAFLLAATGARAQISTWQTLIGESAEAQAAVTAASQAQVRAMTAVNLAAVEGQTAVMDAQVAWAGFGAAAEAAGVSVVTLASDLRDGDASLLAVAASAAKAEIQMELLAAAEDDLAAAQMTVVQVSQSLTGETLATEDAMTAAVAAMDSAQAQVDALSSSLGIVAEVELSAADAARELVASMTEVNLAAIQNETAAASDEAGLAGLSATAQTARVELSALAESVEEGNYASVTYAASMAKAQIQSNLLAEAQEQLAAANMTLVQTYRALADGEDVSKEAQLAALAGVKSAQSEVTALGGSLGTVSNDAEKTTKSFGGMGEMMYGPWGMAAYMALSILPELGSMFDSNAVSAADFTSAVTQDSNAVGDNTAATIQQTLASSNLSDISKTLGLSQAQLIEYAAGEANVQAQVAAAYDKTTSAMAKQAQGTAQGGPESGREAGYALNKLEQQKAYLDQVTASVQQAIQEDAANSAALLAAEQTTQIYNASVNALGESQLQQVESTQMSNQATVEFGSRLMAAETSVQYMNAAVGAAGVNLLIQANATEITNMATAQYGAAVLSAESSVTSMDAAMAASVATERESALTSAQASVGLLQLGSSQTALNSQLVSGESSYAQASAGAQAYSTALTSLSGTANTLLGDEANFTTELGDLTTAVSTNSTSLDVNTAKGAANVTVVTQIATAADAAAAAVYQNEVAQVGATQAYADANAKLQQEKDAFEAAAEKAGFNKQQVQALANELFQLPKNVSTSVNVDTSAAEAHVNELEYELSRLEGMNAGGSTGGSGTAGTGRNVQFGTRDAGGPVQAGQSYWIGLNGKPEVFTPGASGFITPADMLTPAMAGPGGGGSGGAGSGPIEVHVYLDSREITASVRTSSQQYKRRNSQTGLA
jgi:hypothetical protein